MPTPTQRCSDCGTQVPEALLSLHGRCRACSVMRDNPEPRARILTSAAAATTGPRNATYGDPTENMLNFVNLISAYLQSKYPDQDGHDITLTAEDGAWIMVLSKMARTFTRAPYHEDNYIDAAAYAAMAGEARVTTESP